MPLSPRVLYGEAGLLCSRPSTVEILSCEQPKNLFYLGGHKHLVESHSCSRSPIKVLVKETTTRREENSFKSERPKGHSYWVNVRGDTVQARGSVPRRIRPSNDDVCVPQRRMGPPHPDEKTDHRVPRYNSRAATRLLLPFMAPPLLHPYLLDFSPCRNALREVRDLRVLRQKLEVRETLPGLVNSIFGGEQHLRRGNQVRTRQERRRRSRRGRHLGAQETLDTLYFPPQINGKKLALII